MKEYVRFTDIKRILVINLGGIGDCLLSTPALKMLRRLYPRAYITFFTVPRACEILEGADFINEVIAPDLDSKYYKGFSGIRRWRCFYKLLVSLRRKRFDMTINMRTIASLSGAIKMAGIFFVINSPYRVGRDTERRGFFLNVKLPEKYIGEKHNPTTSPIALTN